MCSPTGKGRACAVRENPITLSRKMLYANSMASRRKSRPKGKSGTRKVRTPRKAFDALEAYMDAAAEALALPIEPQWRAAIKANLAVNLQMAALVAELALPDEAEPAPIFRA